MKKFIFIYILLFFVLSIQILIFSQVTTLINENNHSEINRENLTFTSVYPLEDPLNVYVNLGKGHFYHRSEGCISLLAFEASKPAISAKNLAEISIISAYEACYRGFSPCPECIIEYISKQGYELYELEKQLSNIEYDIDAIDKTLNPYW